nr:actin cytoskeleton-regulatory complex protein PAN1-like [Aegilops tauschii subsp. strangulata]
MPPLALEVPVSGLAGEVPTAPEPAASQALVMASPPPTAAPPLPADREAALKDAEAARDCCRELEDELKSLRDKHAKEARCRQAKEEEMKAREDAVKNRDTELAELGKTQAVECNRLEELEQKVKAREADLDAKARVLAEDRMAFADLEERSRKALKTLYEHGPEKSLATDEDGPARLWKAQNGQLPLDDSD